MMARDGTYWRVLVVGGDGDDTRVPLQGAEDVVPLLVLSWGAIGWGEVWGSGCGDIAGCHCSVLWWGGR